MSGGKFSFPFYLHTFIFVCYDSTEGISLSIFTNCHTMYKMIWFSLNFLCILQTVHYMYFMAPLWLRLFPVYILWYIEFPQFFLTDCHPVCGGGVWYTDCCQVWAPDHWPPLCCTDHLPNSRHVSQGLSQGLASSKGG